MDKEKLAQYRYLKKEIKELEKQLKSKIVTDKVQASNIEFPYQRMHINITGLEDNSRLHRILEKRYNNCNKVRLEIEEFISNIEDSRIRLIFEKRYVECWSWQRISMLIGSHNKSTSKMIHDRYLKKGELCEL